MNFDDKLENRPIKASPRDRRRAVLAAMSYAELSSAPYAEIDGTLTESQMVEAILNHEYPEDKATVIRPTLNLNDSLVRKMAIGNHTPVEVWINAADKAERGLISVHCEMCGQAWPCETRQRLTAMNERDKLRAVRKDELLTMTDQEVRRLLPPMPNTHKGRLAELILDREFPQEI